MLMLTMGVSFAALPPLSFLLIEQAFQWIAGRALAPTLPQLQSTPSFSSTLGVAELINDQLPFETSDGFVFLRARAPAPAALELKILAPSTADASLSASTLDGAWRVGLVRLFCSPTSGLWSRWIQLGGSVGLEVIHPQTGEVLRRYGAASSDCTYYRSLLPSSP